jgi:hypothetical protein
MRHGRFVLARRFAQTAADSSFGGGGKQIEERRILVNQMEAERRSVELIGLEQGGSLVRLTMTWYVAQYTLAAKRLHVRN